jgi:hypothetical protein
MNGPRTLSNDHLSYLIFSAPTCPPEADPTEDADHGIMMCATHFLGDGNALHQSVHDLLCILTSTKNDEELKKELDELRDWVSSLSIFSLSAED